MHRLLDEQSLLCCQLRFILPGEIPTSLSTTSNSHWVLSAAVDPLATMQRGRVSSWGCSHAGPHSGELDIFNLQRQRTWNSDGRQAESEEPLIYYLIKRLNFVFSQISLAALICRRVKLQSSLRNTKAGVKAAVGETEKRDVVDLVQNSSAASRNFPAEKAAVHQIRISLKLSFWMLFFNSKVSFWFLCRVCPGKDIYHCRQSVL